MSWPFQQNRSCGLCGCATEECECGDRKVRELTHLPNPNTDILLEEVTTSAALKLLMDEDNLY